MKKVILGAGILVMFILCGLLIWRYYTKSVSPENSFVYEADDLRISVFYNRPYKKGREIFGKLVPYGTTWRTGANEATVFKSNRDLYIDGKKLPQGEYSFWTVPNERSWQIVFNSSIPSWGIDVMNHGVAARDPKSDILITEVPSMNTPKEFEQFTITVEKVDDMLELILAWDRTLVAIPISISAQ